MLTVPTFIICHTEYKDLEIRHMRQAPKSSQYYHLGRRLSKEEKQKVYCWHHSAENLSMHEQVEKVDWKVLDKLRAWILGN